MGTDYAETREIFLNFVLEARTFPRDWSVARNQPIVDRGGENQPAQSKQSFSRLF